MINIFGRNGRRAGGRALCSDLLAPASWAAALLLLGAASGHAASLPQKHPYQRVLREYIGTLTAKSLAVPLQAVTYRRLT